MKIAQVFDNLSNGDTFAIGSDRSYDIDEDEMSKNREAKARGQMRMGEGITPNRYED
jgi:hypothetical protein